MKPTRNQWACQHVLPLQRRWRRMAINITQTIPEGDLKAMIILVTACFVCVFTPSSFSDCGDDKLWIPAHYDADGKFVPGYFWPPKECEKSKQQKGGE
jgi:hypothetical protein